MFHSHDHGDHHHHHHDDAPGSGSPAKRRGRLAVRLALAGLIAAGAVFASASVMVAAGQATVITRFGDLSRVLVKPGLAWKLPTPIESVIPVDLRLRTSSTGLQDVGTRDGLRVLVQAYVAWQVPPDPERIRQFLRAVRNDPDEAARQIRSLVASALQVTASSFELADLIDTDAQRRQLPAFEARLREQVGRQVLSVFGIQVLQVGIERLSLPDATLAATVARMRAERETVAAARTAEGLRAAAEIRSQSIRDGRILVAKAKTEAADLEAASRREAAETEAAAYRSDPGLYTLLRSMDTLASVVGPNTRMVLRTDVVPFDMLTRSPIAPEPQPPSLQSLSPNRTIGANP